MAATATRRRRRPSAPAERLIAAVLRAQGAFFDAARRPSEEFLRAAIDLPETFDPLDAETIRAAQMEFQARFQERSAERLRLGMRKAMAQPTRQGLIRGLRARQRAATDPDVKARLEQQIEGVRIAEDPRRAAVASLLEQERRLARAHAAAMAGRARGASRSVQVRAESPTGALWMRNPLSDSCDECRFLDGKLWPWEVLDQITPPRHPNCQCVLIPVGAARARGLIGPQARVPTAKQGIQRARRILQETIEGAVLVEAVARGLYHEIEHPRGPHGRWRDKPGASVGTASLDDVADDAFKADSVLMDWGRFWDGWEREGVTVRITKAHGYDHLGVAAVRGEFHKDGEKVGDFGRTFREGRITNVMLQTYKGAPPATGTMFVRDSLHKARGDPQIRTVHFQAGWAAGGYVWAREGGIPDQPFDGFQRYVNNERILTVKYEMEQAGVPTDAYVELRRRLEAGEFSTAAEIAAFGRDVTWTDREGRTMWPGKVVMLGTEWSATFDVGSYLMEMLRGLALWDLSERMGLMLPPDPLDRDDRAFWDLAERITEDVDWREALHPRGLHGRWTDSPVSVGRQPVSRPAPVDKLAVGYAEAAAMVAKGYTDKMEREYDEARVRGWIGNVAQTNIESTLHVGPIEIQAIKWDTGKIRLIPSTSLLDYPASQGEGIYADDPAAGEHIAAEARRLLDAAKARQVEIQRKQARGGITQPNTEEGKVVYPRLREAIAENRGSTRFQRLREAFPDVENNVIVVNEKGFGKFPLGISDILVSASNSQHTGVTAINGPALKWEAAPSPELAKIQRSRDEYFKPGMQHGTVRSTAALLRHEWGHSLWRNLTDRQRQEFSDLLPGGEDDGSETGGRWDRLRTELTQYASSDTETRERYLKQYGEKGYLTETFAEALAVAGDPVLYDPDEWPGWVNRVADWIDTLEDDS